MTLPYSYEWEAWMRGVEKYRAYGPKDSEHRPDVPKPYPPEWKIPYYTRMAAVENVGKPWFGPGRSPFLGLGAFLAHDPWCVRDSRILAKLDYVVFKGDGGDAYPDSDIIAKVYREAGLKHVGVWYSWDGPVVLEPTDVGADGWIGQDEKAEDSKAYALAFAKWGGRGVVVSNNWTAHDAPFEKEVLAEAYLNCNGRASPRNVTDDAIRLKAKWAAPVYGVGGAGGPWSGANRVVSFEEYEKAWGGPDRAVWLAEYLTASDVEYIRDL